MLWGNECAWVCLKRQTACVCRCGVTQTTVFEMFLGCFKHLLVTCSAFGVGTLAYARQFSNFSSGNFVQELQLWSFTLGALLAFLLSHVSLGAEALRADPSIDKKMGLVLKALLDSLFLCPGGSKKKRCRKGTPKASQKGLLFRPELPKNTYL